MNKQETITVEYGCDLEGDRTVSMVNCTHKRKKTFKSLKNAQPFINSCTIVHNLDELFNTIPLDQVPNIDKALFV